MTSTSNPQTAADLAFTLIAMCPPPTNSYDETIRTVVVQSLEHQNPLGLWSLISQYSFHLAYICLPPMSNGFATVAKALLHEMPAPECPCRCRSKLIAILTCLEGRFINGAATPIIWTAIGNEALRAAKFLTPKEAMTSA